MFGGLEGPPRGGDLAQASVSPLNHSHDCGTGSGRGRGGASAVSQGRSVVVASKGVSV